MMNLPFKAGDRVLELGGGDLPCHRPNADIRWAPAIDYPGVDFNYPLPFKDDEWPNIHARYLLEHLSWRKVPAFLQELHRILTPGGLVAIETANLLEQCKVALKWFENGKGLEVSQMLFGDQDYPGNSHKAGFSPELITRLLQGASFFFVEVTPIQTEAGPTDVMVIARKSKAIVGIAR